MIIDPDTPWEVSADRMASRSRNTPYVERTLPVSVWATFLRGRPTVMAGALV